MPKGNEKGTSTLKQIMTYAKKIRSEHPNKAWKECVADASKMYRENKNKK